MKWAAEAVAVARALAALAAADQEMFKIRIWMDRLEWVTETLNWADQVDR